jgi:hypothetical protein
MRRKMDGTEEGEREGDGGKAGMAAHDASGLQRRKIDNIY